MDVSRLGANTVAVVRNPPGGILCTNSFEALRRSATAYPVHHLVVLLEVEELLPDFFFFGVLLADTVWDSFAGPAFARSKSVESCSI